MNPRPQAAVEPAYLPYPGAEAFSGLGTTTLRAAVKAGRLRAKRYGKRTLIDVQSLRAFMESLPEAAPRKAA